MTRFAQEWADMPALRALSRPWVTTLLVLGFALCVRLPHYDVSWFGNDQINFVAEGRRILSGDWNIVGPRAAGFNIIGPLYSFFVAGLLWIGEDATFVAFVNAMCEVAAAWLVYDTARRLSGQAAGVAAGVTYATAPVLIISTRLIWNPSLLPAAVALGCWLVVRYRERPSTGRLVAVALACGLAMTLHATAIFPAAAWVLIALLTKWPTPRQMAAAVVVGLLPLTPGLLRLVTAEPSPGGAGLALGANDALATIAGIAKMTLRFPIGAYQEHWSALPSAVVLHIDALVATIGLAIGVAWKTAYRPVWIGLLAALVTHLIGAIVFPGPLAWYYFTGAVPIVCLCVGHGIGVWPRVRVGAVALIVCLATAHVVFVHHFDRPAIENGFIRMEPDGLVLRLPPGGPSYGITLRDVRNTATALRDTFPDGVTAMRASHGMRAELWRESGAEFMPRVSAPRDDWASEFVLMGEGATARHPGARVIGERTCVFERPSGASWRVWPADVPAGWELPAFADDRWYELPLPRRMTGPLSAGPAVPVFWRTPRQFLRGRVNVERPSGQHLYVVSLHSTGSSQHWVERFVVNGIDVSATKSRAAHSAVFRNEEWLFDLTGRMQQGENLIALTVDGQTPAFDVDVFELPCLDREWYNADR